jgi:C4-dicarboxylate-specific signal transduction histidine kinase
MGTGRTVTAVAESLTAEAHAGETNAPVPARRSRAGAEAARYGVLRRLGPALKHDMVVNLQAIAMMAEVLNAKLDRGAPDPAEFHTSISKLNRLARQAVASCLKVAAWLEPGEDEGVRLAEGVDECLALLASNFNFRGFLVSRELADTPFRVSRVALRNLLIGSLITLTDAAGGPCQVKVTAEVVSGVAEIAVRISPRNDDYVGLPYEPSYRQLEWSDVQALAIAEAVELVRGADHIVMRMPRAIATAPLQIAPV